MEPNEFSWGFYNIFPRILFFNFYTVNYCLLGLTGYY